MDIPAFVLASGSPRRRQLLEEAGHAFSVAVSPEPEPNSADFPDVAAFVTHAAWRKARTVAAAHPSPDRWFLAADTVAAIDGHILGKPADPDDARRILGLLMGTTHETWTGVCLWIGRLDISLIAAERTLVTMRNLSPDDLERYIASDGWRGKAGAYGIQDRDDPFVRCVSGSWSNVVGLPMERVEPMLRQAALIDPPRD